MELSSPITIYWDISPGLHETSHLLEICDQIKECRPLILNISLSEAVIDEALSSLLENLKSSSIAVSLTVPVSNTGKIPSLAAIEPAVREMLFSNDSLETVRQCTFPQRSGISFRVTSGNWREIPDLFRYCLDNGIYRIVFDMQRLYAGETPFYLDSTEQSELSEKLTGFSSISELNLTIHDPFLWRAVYPGKPFPQGGCQAANTMIAVCSDDSVYPCPSLPVNLGKIGAGLRLKAIIASDAKKSLRGLLLKEPASCRGCAKTEICLGGCRGRGLVVFGSLDGIDVACR